jgi:hypothetical protein
MNSNGSAAALIEIPIRVTDSQEPVLGDTQDPNVLWELLERRFGAKQGGPQAVLMKRLQMTNSHSPRFYGRLSVGAG